MRREFSKKTKLVVFERAKGNCESCDARLCVGHTHYDHRIPDALGGEPSIENCQVLCTNCHGAKTARDDIPTIAKSNRVRARHIGIRKRSTFRGWRKFDGTAVKNPRTQ